MAGLRKAGNLAPAGSTGNATHGSVAVPSEADGLTVEFEVEVAGATPTITFNVQGSMDDPEIPDAQSDWFEVFGLPSGGAAEVDVSGTVTAVGISAFHIELSRRPVRKLRLVTSANTNITYNCELYADEA